VCPPCLVLDEPDDRPLGIVGQLGPIEARQQLLAFFRDGDIEGGQTSAGAIDNALEEHGIALRQPGDIAGGVQQRVVVKLQIRGVDTRQRSACRCEHVCAWRIDMLRPALAVLTDRDR
jgi:hypothetical protein